MGERSDERVELSAAPRAERARLRHTVRRALAHQLVLGAIACTTLACSEQEHVVGLHDVRIANGASGASGVSGQGSGGQAGVSGRPPPSDDGSTSFADAAIPDATTACPNSLMPTVRKRLDLYLLLDTNFVSSANQSNWQKVVQGVEEYSRREEAAGTGLGLRVIDPPEVVPFIDPSTCDPDTYSEVSAVISPDPLPANVDAIASALSNVTISLTTPLDPALEGGIDYAFSRKGAYPDQVPAVVLLSDAFFDFNCGSSVDDLTQTAARGLANLGVRSYMVELIVPIDFGVLDPVVPDLPTPTIIPLNPVANAGGTHHARFMDMEVAGPSKLADVLLEIQHDAEPCDYRLPPDTPWEDAILAVDTGSGPGPLPRLSSASECEPTGVGAYLDESTGTPWARACKLSCDAIKATARAPLWIVGCDPNDP